MSDDIKERLDTLARLGGGAAVLFDALTRIEALEAQFAAAREALQKIGGDLEYSAADIASHAQKPHKTIDESVAEDALASLPSPEAAPTPDLTDPNVVHANMLRGTIAKPTWEQIKHLYPEQAAAPTREEMAKIVYKAMRGAADPSIYGADHAAKMNEVTAFKATDAILALKAAPAK